MEFAEAINSFLSKYEYLLGRVRGIEVLFCIIEVKKGNNKGYYNFYTRAYGVEGTTDEGPIPLQYLFPLLKEGSRVELNRSTNLLLFGWKTDTGGFFKWLRRYDVSKNILPWPGESGGGLTCYFGTPSAFINFETDTTYYFNDYPYTAELRIPGDKEAIASVMTGDIIRKALRGIKSQLKMELVEDITPIYGGVDVLIPETRFAVKWKGSPPTNEEGFIIKLFEKEPDVLNGATFVVADSIRERVFRYDIKRVESSRMFIPGFLPKYLCNILVMKKGRILFQDDNYLIKSLKLQGGMVCGRKSVEFKNGSGKIRVFETKVVSPFGNDRRPADRSYDMVALREKLAFNREKRELFVFNRGRTEEGENNKGFLETVFDLVNRATHYVKLWDPYLGALDILEISTAIASNAVIIRAITSLGVPPSKEEIPLRTEEKLLYTVRRGRDEVEFRFLNENSPESKRQNFRTLNDIIGSIKLDIEVKSPGRGASGFHDRFLIVDGNVWMLGHSFNNPDTKFSVITKIKDGEIIEEAFDTWWAECLPINL